MKSPARAKGSSKPPTTKSAGGTARKPTKPVAQAKQVATPRRSSPAPKKPAAVAKAPAKLPAAKPASAKAAPAKPVASKAPAAKAPVAKTAGTRAGVAKPAEIKTAAAKPATPAPKPAATRPSPAKTDPASAALPPKAERGTTAGSAAKAPAALPANPATAAKAAAPPARPSPPKPAAAAAPPVAMPTAATPPPTPPPAVVPSTPVAPKVAPVPKSVAPKAAPVPKPPVTAAPVNTPPASTPVATDSPVSEAVPPRPTHIPHKMGGAPMTTPRLAAKPTDFKAGDMVVYPTHGVGSVQGIETVSAAGYSLSVIVVTFEENRMTLRVPVNKAASSGLRKLASNEGMKEALDTLKGRARIKRTMWSRRAQEYEAKINSGDPVAIAEVVRDLHRNAGQPDQSFSERQIYEQALDRLATEVAAIDRTDKVAATEKLILHLKGGN